MKQERKIVNIGIHIITWICFFLLPYIFSLQQKEPSLILTKHFTTYFIVINLFLLGFYYLNTQLLITKLLFARKWILYLLSVALCLLVFLYAPREITHLINNTNEQQIKEEFRLRKQFLQPPNEAQNNTAKKTETNPKPPKSSIQYFPGSFVVFLLIFTIGICLSVLDQWRTAERKKEQIENEKINTELSFLKSQVNPHFFFNTLNNIYSLAVVNSDKTAPTVLKLSSIMRYILTESQLEKVPLEKEIDFLKNFIDLQLVRLTDKVKVDFKIEGDIINKEIAPLLFIPFVENAFKYGISTKEHSQINIELSVKDTYLHFTVINTIVKCDTLQEETTGIGINNVKRRLELSYPNKYLLKVTPTDSLFKVHLEIYFV